MANLKISELQAFSGNVQNGDLFEVVDTSDTSMAPTGTNKKVTWQDMKGDLNDIYLRLNGANGPQTGKIRLKAAPVATDRNLMEITSDTGAQLLTISNQNTDAQGDITLDFLDGQLELFGGVGVNRTANDGGTIFYVKGGDGRVRQLTKGGGTVFGLDVTSVVPTEALEVVGNVDITGQYLINGVPISTGGIPDAPSDGTTYGRNNAAWVAVRSKPNGLSKIRWQQWPFNRGCRYFESFARSSNGTDRN